MSRSSSPQIIVLGKFLSAKKQEIIKHRPTVYEWEGILFEIAGETTKTVGKDHYVKIKIGKKEWYIRELGKQSKIYKEIYDN